MPLTAALWRRTLGSSLLALVLSTAAGAQTIAFFGDRLRLAGEASGTIAPDDEGYFNYSDYATSSLRLFRVDLAAEARITAFASALADVRTDNLGSPRVYALYLRLRPWRERNLDLQAGIVPPVFGAYPRRRYASENPLPSVPLAYQYLTDLRYDAIPATAEQLVARRARGWSVSYPIGSPVPAPGLPLVNAERWDTGIELRLGDVPAAFSLALTQGSPSHPTVSDDNSGKQLSGRLAWTPGPWLTAGLSAASGDFLSSGALAAVPEPDRGRHRQDAFGADVQWSRGYWIVRGEAIYSRWSLPAIDETRIEAPLSAFAAFAEARYKIRPGLYVAGRVERLTFDRIETALGQQTWDAPVTRFELGAGFVPHRHALVKASWQHNQRDGGRVRRNDLLAAQLVLWF